MGGTLEQSANSPDHGRDLEEELSPHEEFEPRGAGDEEFIVESCDIVGDYVFLPGGEEVLWVEGLEVDDYVSRD